MDVLAAQTAWMGPGYTLRGPCSSLGLRRFLFRLGSASEIRQLIGPEKELQAQGYSVIRSFFLHNRAPLPADPTFRMRGDKPPVQAKLSKMDISEILLGAELRYRSMILVKWQGLLDNERLIYVSNHCSDQVVRQIRAGERLVRLDLPGRKSNENDAEGCFYTYIGSDAVSALTQYFERERDCLEAVNLSGSMRMVIR